MTSTSRLLLASSAALTLASCSWFNRGGQGDYDTQPASGGYDTSNNQYGVPGGGGGAPSTPPSNPTYSQAAYEDSGVSSAADTPSAPPASTPSPSAPVHSTPSASAPVSRPSGSGTVHTVVKGDTLWGIGKKYSVSVDSIKKANGLTKDTVVLGAKLQIPAKN